MKDMQGFSIVMNFVIFPIFFLSGALYPVENFPSWLRILSYLDPLTYGIDGLRAILIDNSSFPLTLNLGLVLIAATGMVILGAYLFERSETI
jgi:ABC-2 type transport system permease protein